MKYSKLPLSILLIFLTFTLATVQGWIPSGFELLSHLQTSVGQQWFWLAVFCIFLEALVLLCLYFPGQFIAVLLVLASGPNHWDIVLLSLAMVMAATAGSCVNYVIGRYLQRRNTDAKQGYQAISYKTLLPAMVHSSGLAFFTFHWGLQRGTPWLLLISSLINIPYYILIVFMTVIFGEQIIQATDNPLILGSALTIWLIVALYRDWHAQRLKNAD